MPCSASNKIRLLSPDTADAILEVTHEHLKSYVGMFNTIQDACIMDADIFYVYERGGRPFEYILGYPENGSTRLVAMSKNSEWSFALKRECYKRVIKGNWRFSVFKYGTNAQKYIEKILNKTGIWRKEEGEKTITYIKPEINAKIVKSD